MYHGSQGMRTRVRGRGCLTLLLGLLLAWPASAGRNLEGEVAPDFVLKSLGGDNLRLSEYQGSVVLLTFWAPWCGDCREQLSTLNAMQSRYGLSGLKVVSVSLDKHVHRVEEMARGMQLNFPVLLDLNKQVARLYDPGKLPLIVLIDPAGHVRYVHEGYRSNDKQLHTAQLEKLLADYGPLSDQG
jgi:peroxiredoxin